MGSENLAHMLKNVIMGRYCVEISITKLTMLRFSILNMQIVDIIAFIIMNFLSIMNHKL